MDRNSLLNDTETATRYGLDGRQAMIWTAMPAIVFSVNMEAMTLQATPSIMGVQTSSTGVETPIPLPLLVDVPICFPSAGGFMMTFPIVPGDEVLIIIANRCIDAWWQLGGIQVPMESRMHDLSDGFAIPGPKSLPNTFPGISATEVQLRDKLGTTYFSVTPAGLFGFQNPVTSLKTTLTNLNSAINTFMEVLAAFSGGGSPTTQAMLQVPAAAAVTALAAVQTEIGALLK